ncbi:NifU family protein [Zhouia sp. PK063]|uniref:NifU family protein n=1 Tax=Zhouia sp. PK063 TaxID=3373602 RepID=UPI0037A82850
MKKHNLKISQTNNSTIIKFETDVFLARQKSYEFKNIDEAKNSPLAQQLFYLPFVKTVYISANFVALQRYDIVEWPDVQEEVKVQIENYLNEGRPVFNEAEDLKSIPVTVYAEVTPNPAVMKFVANKKLVLKPMEFKSIDDTKQAPLPQALFHFPFVKEVFVDENYVSIMKYDIAEWEDINMELREFIRKHIESGKEIANAAPTPTSSSEKAENVSNINIDHLDDTSKQIVAILDEYVKPAVASDGGNIMFKSYDENTKQVNVILQGACSGCPSSTFTLKNGIESMLKEMLQDKVSTVVAING